MEKLKKEVWSINTKGTGGPNANTDIAFGITEDGKSALRLDDEIVTNQCDFWESGTGIYSVKTKGTGCLAKGENSVAEGELSVTGTNDSIEDWCEGKGAHSEGGNTTAAGNYSHTEGNSTVANNPYEHAEGHFNYSHYSRSVYPDAGNTIHSVGIGSNISNRKNAIEIMQNGDVYIFGIGGYDGTNPEDSYSLQEIISQLLNIK